MNTWVTAVGALVFGGAAGAGACIALSSGGGAILDPSIAVGTVYVDTDGDGVQDDDEPGVPGAEVLVETDSHTVRILTSPEGEYHVQMPIDRFTISVEPTSLGFPGQLTTGRESYSLTVPPGFFAPNVDFGYQEVDPSSALGVVFEDLDGDGVQSEGEAGIAGVTITVTATETGAVTELVTDDQGEWRIDSPVTRFTITPDPTDLPFTGQLTTGRESYSLNVPPGFFALGISFGYQEVEPSSAYGVVFEDLDGDGVQSEGEAGIEGITIGVVTESGRVYGLVTDDQGEWSVESDETRFTVTVNPVDLPFTGQLTTGRESYSLNVPPGFFAPGINFGYQEVGPGTASGVVFEDLDGDGERQEGEPGVGGVDVVLLAQDGSGDVVVVTTRADGRWSHARGVTMAVVSLDTRSLPDRDGRAASLTTDPSTYAVDLSDGADRDGLDFGVQWVSRPGRATAPPTGDPTREPTGDPTADPSGDPTVAPTETADPSPEPTDESCELVGLWDLRDQPFLDQLTAAGVGAGAGDVSIEYLSGVHTVEMRADGTYTTVRGDWTLRTATPDGAIVIAIDGVDDGTWSATDTQLSIADPGSTATVQMFVEQGGQRIPIPQPPGGATGSEPISGSGPYTCEGDVLTVTFEGFTSTFDRIG